MMFSKLSVSLSVYLKANMGQISFFFLTLLVSSSLAASCNNLQIDAGIYCIIDLFLLDGKWKLEGI